MSHSFINIDNELKEKNEDPKEIIRRHQSMYRQVYYQKEKIIKKKSKNKNKTKQNYPPLPNKKTIHTQTIVHKTLRRKESKDWAS
jgi:hypothetical protein